GRVLGERVADRLLERLAGEVVRSGPDHVPPNVRLDARRVQRKLLESVPVRRGGGLEPGLEPCVGAALRVAGEEAWPVSLRGGGSAGEARNARALEGEPAARLDCRAERIGDEREKEWPGLASARGVEGNAAVRRRHYGGRAVCAVVNEDGSQDVRRSTVVGGVNTAVPSRVGLRLPR